MTSQSAVLLEGEVSEQFSTGLGVAQGCSMSPILFSIFINQLLDEVEKAGIGITVKKDVKVGGLMFADDFVGLTTTAEDLQTLINIVQGFCNKWRLKSNIKKSAVMVFSKQVNTGACTWKWGDKDIPEVVSYCYLGIEFAKNGSRYSHVQKVINKGKKKLNQLHRFLSNRNISTVARRLLLVSVLRPTLEYGSEVWACNKRQTASLESIQLGAAKKMLGCSSKTCNEAVRGVMGLESLKGRRDRCKLKWWYKYRIHHVYKEYKRRYIPLGCLPLAIALGKPSSGVYRVYTPSRRGISGLYHRRPIAFAVCHRHGYTKLPFSSAGP